MITVAASRTGGATQLSSPEACAAANARARSASFAGIFNRVGSPICARNFDNKFDLHWSIQRQTGHTNGRTGVSCSRTPTSAEEF